MLWFKNNSGYMQALASEFYFIKKNLEMRLKVRCARQMVIQEVPSCHICLFATKIDFSRFRLYRKYVI